MKKICIFGAGGFAKEVYALLENLGMSNIICAFIDTHEGSLFNIPIKTENFFDYRKHLPVIAIGNPNLREIVVSKLLNIGGVEFPTFIHPSAIIMKPYTIHISEGVIICANCVVTCDVNIGPWSHLNLASTIGHDVVVGKFFTTAPGVHINGNNNIGDRVYFGSNASTIEKITIASDVVIGAGACVIRDIINNGTYVGIPAKKVN
jgi:sugar O-acyltransferase (sialic acid O-acetyltransferase NeuD family)